MKISVITKCISVWNGSYSARSFASTTVFHNQFQFNKTILTSSHNNNNLVSKAVYNNQKEAPYYIITSKFFGSSNGQFEILPPIVKQFNNEEKDGNPWMGVLLGGIFVGVTILNEQLKSEDLLDFQ